MRQVLGNVVLMALTMVVLLSSSYTARKKAEAATKQRTGRGCPPRSEKEFRKYIEELGPEFLTSLNIETPHELFVFSRDGKSYIVVYGKMNEIETSGAVGEGGTKWVAHNLSGADELNTAAFQESVPDAK